MNKKILLITIPALIIIISTAAWTYLRGTLPFVNNNKNLSKNTVNPTDKITESNIQAVDIKVEVFAENLFVPWSIVFTSETRVLVTERSGGIKVIENGNLQKGYLKQLPEVQARNEEGLMGMTLDPDYLTNKLLYISYAYPKNNAYAVKVVRLKDNSTALNEDTVIIDNIPAAEFHAGSRIKFGPDKKLYITTGDSFNRNLAQDKNSLAGKILRSNPDGSIPSDNPSPNSLVYSSGHRNPQGIAWHPESKELFETEHGPSGSDGPGGGDEVNIIKKGGNYGWPIVSHDKNREGLMGPKLVFTPAIAPASAMFYTSDKIPQFKNNLFFSALKGEGIYRAIVSKSNPDEIESYEKLAGINFGRIRDITEGPDGGIYFSTSNRDGRGSVKSGDDKIYRILPK